MAELSSRRIGRVTVWRTGATAGVVVRPANGALATVVMVPLLGFALFGCVAGASAMARRSPAFAVAWILMVAPMILVCAGVLIWEYGYVQRADIDAGFVVVDRRCGPWRSTERLARADVGWVVPTHLRYRMDPYYPDVTLGGGMWTVALVGASGKLTPIAAGLTLVQAALIVRTLDAMGFPSAGTDEITLKRLADVEVSPDAAADASSVSAGRTAWSARRR